MAPDAASRRVRGLKVAGGQGAAAVVEMGTPGWVCRQCFPAQRIQTFAGPQGRERVGGKGSASMPRTRAFTLVEVLIVVIILAILAAIVLPKFSNASAVARASMLADDLRLMRAQIQVFRAQHNDVAPGYPNGISTGTPTQDAFVSHLTKATNKAFGVAEPGTAGFPFGPYFSSFPENPINGLQTVKIVANAAAFPATADDSFGWVYQGSTLIFKADSAGVDDKGVSYFDY
jgi:prepilin-type N-terminal cleavage/methylation domain-containing protein